MRILLLTIDLASNATGRTYVLWLVAHALGWETTVVAPSGDSIWAPVAGSEFAKNCIVLREELSADNEQLDNLARSSDLIIAVKPLPSSYGRAIALHRQTGVPVLLDIDDPTLEARLRTRQPVRLLGHAVVRPRTFWPLVRLYAHAKREQHVIVSNPTLQRRWGGAVVPHAREDTGDGLPHESSSPRVVFVGTNSKHKGMEVLRSAIEQCQDLAVTLTVTDSPPIDALPWESWVGRTTLAEGRALVRSADIVVLPSLPGATYSEAQLPAKLIDAMIAGRAIIVSNRAPIEWALGGSGVVVDSYDAESFAKAIRDLADPGVRRALGQGARNRALSHFSVEGVQDAFEKSCNDAAYDR